MRLLLICALPMVVCGQVFPPPQQPQFFRIKEFLQLSDSQFISIFRNLEEHQRLASTTAQRVAVLQNEIAIEGNRENPDPLEVGTRYVEMQRICRFLQDEGKQLMVKNGNLLTEAQRTKLKSFEDTAKVLPALVEAQGLQLLGPLQTVTADGTRFALQVNAYPVPSNQIVPIRLDFGVAIGGGCPVAPLGLPVSGGGFTFSPARSTDATR